MITCHTAPAQRSCGQYAGNYVTILYSKDRPIRIFLSLPDTMSQVLTVIALSAFVIAGVLLLLYFRTEAREIAGTQNRRPIPGKYFILVLVACTLSGMAVTEWQGICSLSPWGFVTGIILGSAAELLAYLHRK
jgi:hypothetical protein